MMIRRTRITRNISKSEDVTLRSPIRGFSGNVVVPSGGRYQIYYYGCGIKMVKLMDEGRSIVMVEPSQIDAVPIRESE